MSATPDESRGLAMAITAEPRFIPTVRTVPPPRWSELPAELTDLAEELFRDRWGRDMRHAENA